MRWIWLILKYCALFFIIFSLSGILAYRFLPVPFTPLMVQRVIEQHLDQKKVRMEHDWVSIRRISPNMIQAAVAGEDNNFTSHFGFDLEAIQKAQKANKRGRRLRGASTISQQTSKNAYLWLGRNYIRKGLELYYTVLMEATWSKERIMEVYLNSIEMGDGIFGVEAAARQYFHKPASLLTRSEAAMIVAAFPNPRKRNPAKPNALMLRRQQIILTNMNKIEKVDL
jgi:monofunctional biosynthetic peptidoglycan transglycosylase